MLKAIFVVDSALAGPGPIFVVHALLNTTERSGAVGLFERGDGRGLGERGEFGYLPPAQHAMSSADAQQLHALLKRYHERPLSKYVRDPHVFIVDGGSSYLFVEGDFELQLHWDDYAPDSWMEQVAPLEGFLFGLFKRYPLDRDN